MNKFKIGDRVVVTVGSEGFFRVGSIGTIVGIDGDSGCVVDFDSGRPGVGHTDGSISYRRWHVSTHRLKHISESQENTPWYETEEGKEWLSNQSSVEEQFMQEKQKMMPKIGDRYVNSEEDLEYILAQTGFSEVCLIDLVSGNRWINPVKVVDPFEITEDEWEQISAGDEFVLVE